MGDHIFLKEWKAEQIKLVKQVHPEYSEDDYDTDEKVCSVLRDEIYNQDKYECIVL